jgi:flap endonuclease-1
LKWTEPNEKGIYDFLVKEKGFNEDRVKNGIAKLRKSHKSSHVVQNKLENYFTGVKRKVSVSFLVL